GGVEIWRADMRQGATRNEANRFTAITGTNIGFLQLTRVQNWRFADGTLDIRDSLNVSTVEIRFGAGRKQKAHRFLTSPVGAGAGVPANRYTYQDYVDVPFEAWDIDKNRQLMVSFRDQENNGVFNLNVREPNDMELLTNREYIYIHNVPYEADRPNNNIARDGGQEFEYMYNLWPYLSTGSTWNADMLPNAVLKINAPAITFQSSNIQEIATNRENNQLRLNGKIHVDQHDFVTVRLDPNRRTFRWIVANDGGIYISDDEGGSFVPKNTGMNTNQFYHATKKPKATEYLGGVQDGATLQSQVGFNTDANMPYNERFATRIGDSFESIWHAQRDNLLLASAQRNVIIKSSDGGAIWRNSINGMTDTGFNNTRAPFFTKLANSHRAPDLVFAVSQTGVWRSTDFGDNWTSIPITGTQWGGFLDVEVSDANPNIVWAGGGMSDQRSMYVSQNGGLTFTPVSKFVKALGNITTIVPDPNDENTVYLTFSQYRSPKILRSTDLGRTWEDISGFGAMGTRSMNGFPDVATYCVFVFPDKQKIWAGTEIGLFESLDNGRTWKYANNGLPAVHVWDLKERDGQVIAATHGRGIWTVDMNIRYPNQDAPVTVGLFSNLPEAKPAKVYPNPSQGNIVLELPPSSLNRFEVQVFNALGQEVFREKNINTGKTSLDLSTLQRGNYVLKAYNGKELFTSKIIITD
ncbi:MAG: T9SS type A sorting domain-containing protein, partial [Thermoflexibacter sp.]|nr:T9SS type A sorting domain-containing protein [Thermoflexibacter sp.]